LKVRIFNKSLSTRESVFHVAKAFLYLSNENQSTELYNETAFSEVFSEKLTVMVR